MKVLRYIYILVFLLFIPSFAIAANHYVREGSTGNGDGSNWTNAFTSLPSTLIRGDTYYIGDGTYAGYDFNDAVSGSTYIYIKKATGSAHGTETGWQSSYGDGVALFTSTATVWDFETSYWDVDGVVGSGTSGHGIVLKHTGTGSASYGCQIDTADYVILRHVEIYHDDPCSLGDVAQDGVRATGTPDNITIQYCYIHDWKRNCIIGAGADNWLIEHCYLADSHSSASYHGQGIYMGLSTADNWTIRYNTFKDINGSAVIFFSGACTNIKIYGNLFWEENESTACGIFSVGGVIGHNNNGGNVDGLRFYNNTIIDLDGRAGSGQIGIDSGSDNIAYNNIWYGCSGVRFDCTHDYNASDDTLTETHDQIISSSIFANFAGGNFTLSGATDAGTTLSSPYTTDRVGNTRGDDGTWDRGAFEFGGGTPSIPSNVTLTPIEN